MLLQLTNDQAQRIAHALYTHAEVAEASGSTRLAAETREMAAQLAGYITTVEMQDKILKIVTDQI